MSVRRPVNIPSILLVLVLSMPMIPGVSLGDHPEDLGISVTFTPHFEDMSSYSYAWMDCTITARVVWNLPEGQVSHSRVGLDGGFLGFANNDKHFIERQVYQKDIKYYARDYLDFSECHDAVEARCRDLAYSYIFSAHRVRVVVKLRGDVDVFDEHSYEPPQILEMWNQVAGFSTEQLDGLKIAHEQLGVEGVDSRDVEHTPRTVSYTAAVVSRVSDPNRETGEVALSVDSRPLDSATDVRLELFLGSPPDDPVVFTDPTGNELRLELPGAHRGFDFSPQLLTLQQYDPDNAATEFPVYDVRQVVTKNEGLILLADLVGTYDATVPYANFILRFEDCLLMDLHHDRQVDLCDFAVLARNWRSTVLPSRSDVGGPQGFGLPDGQVDTRDVAIFCQKWARVFREGFESGAFDYSYWTLAGLPSWKITSSESYAGTRSAQAGAIDDDEVTSMWAIVTCHDGEVRFARRVSSQTNHDYLRFKIDGDIQETWSGEVDWEMVSFPVKAGRRTFCWEYIKDEKNSRGDDTAWLDDILLPTD